MLSKTKQSMIEFAESEMLIAKDCKYPLNDYRTRLNNNVLLVGEGGAGTRATSSRRTSPKPSAATSSQTRRAIFTTSIGNI